MQGPAVAECGNRRQDKAKERDDMPRSDIVMPRSD
jgi:hypothetical protein